MEEGLFEKGEVRGRCTCMERIRPLESRSLTICSYYPRRVWGRAREGYDGRKLLSVKCNRCGHVWREYSRKNRLWVLIGDDPFSGEERMFVRNVREDN